MSSVAMRWTMGPLLVQATVLSSAQARNTKLDQVATTAQQCLRSKWAMQRRYAQRLLLAAIQIQTHTAALYSQHVARAAELAWRTKCLWASLQLQCHGRCKLAADLRRRRWLNTQLLRVQADCRTVLSARHMRVKEKEWYDAMQASSSLVQRCAQGRVRVWHRSVPLDEFGVCPLACRPLEP